MSLLLNVMRWILALRVKSDALFELLWLNIARLSNMLIEPFQNILTIGNTKMTKKTKVSKKENTVKIEKKASKAKVVRKEIKVRKAKIAKQEQKIKEKPLIIKHF